MSELIIAIDGPSASGKSTVSRRVAQRLEFTHVDSGSLYRGVTWEFLRRRVAPEDSRAVAAAVLAEIDIEFFVENSTVKFSIGGVNPGEGIRSQAVSENVSPVAALPAVRQWVVRQLRKLVSFGDLVMEGRDIGTAVFPDAQFKFYLDAAPDERARRRYLELANAGVKTEYEDILRSIRRRDGIDSTRALDPLKIAPGAVVIQSTQMSVEEVVDSIVKTVRTRIA